jgi:hypothetical protein
VNTNIDKVAPRYRAHWDSLGLVLSGVCLVHCLMLPIVIGLFPLLGAGILGHQQFHQLLLFLVVPTSIAALWLGYRRHHRGYIIVIGTVGIVILSAVALFAHQVLDARGEILVASLGGVIVAISHIQNLREARKVPCARPDESGTDISTV